MKGYFGKILRVNLTSKKIETDHFDETFARKYIGGNGFAAKYIYDLVDPKADPLSDAFSLADSNNNFAFGRSPAIRLRTPSAMSR